MNREARIRQWHRLFGIALTDVLTDTPWRVELERELALQSQLLDVLIIEQYSALTCAPGIAAYGLPDGLEGLRAHNLLTYKSAHEAMDSWALEELLGHYVNYRKQISGKGKLIAPERFQLYAVATRYPRDLVQQWPLQPTAWSGVFDLAWASHRLRLIVLNRIAQHPRNAPWELFSVQQDLIRHGAQHYAWRRPGSRALLQQLYLTYHLEDPAMSYTMADFIRETHQQLLHNMTPEERQAFLDELPAEERLKGLDPEEVIQRYEPEERLKGLAPEDVIQRYEPEERLKGLDPDDVIRRYGPEELLKRLDPEQVKAWLRQCESE